MAVKFLTGLNVEGNVRITPLNTTDTISFLNLGSNQSRLVTTNNFAIFNGGLETARFFTTGAFKLAEYGSGTFTGTATQRLGVDTSGNVIEIPIGSGAVDGSGTTNFVAKWLDTDTIGNSVIFDNGARVGIANPNPLVTLDVEGAIRSNNDNSGDYAELFCDFDVSGNSFLRSSAGPIVIQSGAPETIIKTLDSSFNAFLTISNLSDVTAVKLNSFGSSYLNGGNVGIGTTSPSKKLQVGNGTGLDDTIRVVYNDGEYTDIHGYGLEMSRTASYIRPVTDGTGNLSIGEDVKSWNSVIQNADTHIFKKDTSEWMRITSAGNVGIGTTAPDSLLEIFTTDAAKDYIKLTSGASGVNPSLIFEKSAVEQGVIQYIRNGDLKIYNTDNDGGVMISGSGATNYDLYINNSGNVGIGTTSPSAQLHSNASGSAINYGMFTIDTDNWINFFTGTGTAPGASAAGQGALFWKSGGVLRLGTSTSTAGGGFVDMVRIGTDGNVGIGTTSPSEKLEVNGNILATSTSNTFIDAKAIGANAYIRAYSDSNSVWLYQGGSSSYLQAQSGSTLRLGSGTANLVITDTSGEVMRTSAGNVGIGTTSPAFKLEVAGTINQTVLQGAPSDNLDNILTTRYFKSHTSTTNTPSAITSFGMGISINYGSTASMQLMSSRNSSLPLYMRKYSNGTWSSWIEIIDSNKISDADIVSWDDAVVRWNGTGGASSDWNNIDENSFIKGHTTTTNYPPELSRSFLSGIATMYSSDNGWQLASNRSSGEGIYFRKTANGTWHGWTKLIDSNDIYVDISNGNIGIGTTSPNKKLHVNSGVINEAARFESTDVGAFIEFKDSGTTDLPIIGAVGNNFDIRTGGSTSVRVTSAGNVGIGTDIPLAKLQVAGGVQMADDTDTASADKVGTQRYREDSNNSYVDMCMKTANATYEWVNIVQNNW